jgi:hypothetical protein
VQVVGYCFCTSLLILQHFKHCPPFKVVPTLLAIHGSERFYHYWNASWNALSVMARISLATHFHESPQWFGKDVFSKFFYFLFLKIGKHEKV